ncbi:hypothetical protein BOTBODRAFT_180952 [Botryobasidium botryosum FD-172 SS1]|uniref:Uncharacterized protein n=1 Tax=Botryobasidium botryosum (strain FD-172 SS1) TaxID=930990 RepID=A0A067M6A7_BOTB1|nr:hypothetical protein BOTBODRAFT_180952 [Botryobasidium botryosum FD-172 SS1]
MARRNDSAVAPPARSRPKASKSARAAPQTRTSLELSTPSVSKEPRIRESICKSSLRCLVNSSPVPPSPEKESEAELAHLESLLEKLESLSTSPSPLSAKTTTDLLHQTRILHEDARNCNRIVEEREDDAIVEKVVRKRALQSDKKSNPTPTPWRPYWTKKYTQHFAELSKIRSDQAKLQRDNFEEARSLIQMHHAYRQSVEHAATLSGIENHMRFYEPHYGHGEEY